MNLALVRSVATPELARLHAQVDAALLITEFLEQLQAIADDEESVSLTEAAHETGYSTDHLSRLIRSGRLANYGRKHAPRVRVSECPQKASSIAIPARVGYDPSTDARSLRVRR